MNNKSKKIENTIVKSYKKIEETVVNTYQKIEDKFIYKYLIRDNETLKEAKERLKKERGNK